MFELSTTIHLFVANWYSRRDRELVQTATMLLPSEITQGRGMYDDVTTHFSRRLTVERRVSSSSVEVALETP